MVRGHPYCKICAVKLITKGYIAVKLEDKMYEYSEVGEQSPAMSRNSEL